MASRGARAGAAVLVAVEVLGCVLMWSANPLAWMWVAARVYEATGSIFADLVAGLGGFTVTTMLMMEGLNRVDAAWVQMRRRAGHDQREGMLTRVVVVSMTFVIVAFYIWFHFIEEAFVIPFMPLN